QKSCRAPIVPEYCAYPLRAGLYQSLLPDRLEPVSSAPLSRTSHPSPPRVPAALPSPRDRAARCSSRGRTLPGESPLAPRAVLFLPSIGGLAPWHFAAAPT